MYLQFVLRQGGDHRLFGVFGIFEIARETQAHVQTHDDKHAPRHYTSNT